jgi:hypothetical protein
MIEPVRNNSSIWSGGQNNCVDNSSRSCVVDGRSRVLEILCHIRFVLQHDIEKFEGWDRLFRSMLTVPTKRRVCGQLVLVSVSVYIEVKGNQGWYLGI